MVSRGPWSINDYYMILNEILVDTFSGEIDFSTTQLWVQIHGLPMKLMSNDNARLVGNRIGVTIDLDKKNNWIFFPGKFLRVKVEVKISKPLLCGFFQSRKGRGKS